MPVKSRWVQYKNYSGYLATGGPKIDQPVDPSMHIARAVYLAGQLEAGSWGTVQGYDGCGMSGGILHNIGVSPKDLSQGDFWALIYTISVAAPAAFRPVGDKFAATGWKVAMDGRIRNPDGTLVPGKKIRFEISGAEGGNVPKNGPDSDRARGWAEAFFNLLTLPVTYKSQSDFAAQWLASMNAGDELAVYRRYTAASKIDSMIAIPVASLPPEVEMAMDVYHAFSVNAPGIAKGVLAPFITQLPNLDAATFATRLIRNLGKKQFGNWQDDPGDGSNRYDRTRLAVWARGDLWDKTLARRLMPRDL